MEKASSNLNPNSLLDTFPLMKSIFELKGSLIIIEGASGSGKTALARDILHSLEDTVYIDGLNSKDTETNKPYNKNTFDFKKRYLFDSPSQLIQENLTKYIKGIVGRGGIAIILCQHIKDINKKNPRQ